MDAFTLALRTYLMRGSITVLVEPSRGVPSVSNSCFATSYVRREFFDTEYEKLTSTSLLSASPKRGISNPFLLYEAVREISCVNPSMMFLDVGVRSYDVCVLYLRFPPKLPLNNSLKVMFTPTSGLKA